jgi:hypothetical protein
MHLESSSIEVIKQAAPYIRKPFHKCCWISVSEDFTNLQFIVSVLVSLILNFKLVWRMNTSGEKMKDL